MEIKIRGYKIVKKVKFLSTSVIVLFLLTICASCGKNSTSVSIETKRTGGPAVTQTTNLTSTTETAQINFPYFSKDQVLDDYNTMLDILDKNYPNFTTAKHLYGANKEEIYAKYKNILENHAEEFKINEIRKVFQDFIHEFGMAGHLQLVSSDLYQIMVESGVPDKILTNKDFLRTLQYVKDTANYSYIPHMPKRIENLTYPEIPTDVKDTTEINQNLSYNSY